MLKLNKFQKMAARLITREAIETNKILGSSRIKVSFRNHYTCPITGIVGIAGLISSYFHANNAVCVEGSERGELRSATVEKALFFADICMHVRKAIGNNRYSDASIRVYLTSKKSDKLGKFIVSFPLTCDENSTGLKPLTKYYWKQ